MNSLDTVKLKTFSLDCLNQLNESGFERNIKELGGKVVSDKLNLIKDKKPIGVNSVSIENMTGEMIITLSAKSLEEDYISGININTVERALSQVNKSGFVKIDVNDFIDECAVLTCDVTDNLKVHGDVANYIDNLSLYRLNEHYKVHEYTNRDSIVFDRAVKSYKERTTLYHKHNEVMRDKTMLGILFEAGRGNDFRNILRMETNLAQARRIREYFDIEKYKHSEVDSKGNLRTYIQLTDVLSSEEKVNSKIFERITEKDVPRLFTEYENSGKTFKQIEQDEGMKSIITKLDGDIRLIRKFIQSHVSGNVSRYIKRYKEKIIEMEQSGLDVNKKSEIEGSIVEIRDLLTA
jgi:hypothetical protein